MNSFRHRPRVKSAVLARLDVAAMTAGENETSNHQLRWSGQLHRACHHVHMPLGSVG